MFIRSEFYSTSHLFLLQDTFRGCLDCLHLVEVTLEVRPYLLLLLQDKSILASHLTLQVRLCTQFRQKVVQLFLYDLTEAEGHVL